MKPAVLAAVLAAVSVPSSASATAAALEAVATATAADATVVAVIDGSFMPYHADFDARRMPQHLDAEAGNDLPLERSPHEWLSGFPDPSTFASYRRLVPSRGHDATPTASLAAVDELKWQAMPRSSRGAAHLTWLSGTKIVGALNFGVSPWLGTNDSHGAKTSSVAAGNLHGTCPECLVVLLAYDTADDAEAAIEWATAQPWIDVVTNSYGFSSTDEVRDRMYSGSDVAATRTASERGQTILFSAGNGLRNDFKEPNPTLFSSQEGPDWILTVGATDPDGGNYTGSGKPVDVAAIGSRYPALGGTTVAGAGTFGGTSNATPLVAGLYARALLWARAVLDGPSRTQEAGTIATGGFSGCSSGASCSLADGALTASELRTAVLRAAIRTPQGARYGHGVPIGTVGGQPIVFDPGPLPVAPDEAELAAEGHGTFWGRFTTTWAAEQERILGALAGSLTPFERPAGEADWFVVDSWCRQQIWGEWSQGAWQSGQPLPVPDPLWPLRTALGASCDRLFPPM